MNAQYKTILSALVLLPLLTGRADATKVTFDNAAASNNADIPRNYGSYIAGDTTGFVTTDGSGATPHIGLTWLGNIANEWEYHTATTWVHESPVFVAQMDHNRDSSFDDVAEVVFNPIDGRSVVINSFLLSGATDQNDTSLFDWEVVGTASGGSLSVPVGGNTGTVNVGFTGDPGVPYTLRFTRDASGFDSGFGTALDDLSFGETLSPGAPVFKLTVNRSTGGITLTNIGTTATTIKGYSITSEAGALSQAGWKPVSGNYDMSGNGSVDSNDSWSKLSQAGDNTDFSEFEFGGDGGVLGAGAAVVLSQSAGNAWLKSPLEDLAMEVVLASGDIFEYSVEYINGPSGGYAVGDLNFDGAVNALDWPAYHAGRGVDLSGMSAVEAYRLGDLDGDLDNDIADFVLFKQLATGGLAAAEAIPEPVTSTLLLAACGLLCARRPSRGAVSSAATSRRRTAVKNQCPILLGTCTLMIALAGSTQATVLNFNFNEGGGVPANNSDLTPTYGSNVTASNIIGATAGAEGFTPNISLTWAPTGGTVASGPDIDILEFHSAGSFAGAGFSVPVVQFDLDMSGHSELPADPTVDFQVGNGKALHLDSLKIGNATDQGEPAYSWTIDLIRLSDMQVVATQTTGLLSAGSLETVTFDYTGTTNEDYRLFFDDGGANTVRSAIDDLKFSETIGGFTPQLTLVVSTTTGWVELKNESGQSFTIDSYEITSPSNSLDPLGWKSLQHSDHEGNGAPGTGNGWEEASGSDTGALIEDYLLGDSTLANGASIFLGQAFDFDKVGGESDLEFGYHVDGSGGFLTAGGVEYISPVLDADFDNDGDVDGGDFLVWQRGLGLTGAAATNANGNADGDADVDGADLAAWKVKFGAGVPLVAASSSVPEPTSACLFMFAGLGWLVGSRRSRGALSAAGGWPTKSTSVAALAATFFVLLAASSAMATKTNDRRYEFGDGGTSNMQDSEFIISSQDKQDLSVFSASELPTFANVSSTGLNRPGAATGDKGAQFDGVNDVLSGIPLNRPDETAGPDFVGIGPILFPFPYNYDKITTRGLQMWVYPDAAAIGSEAIPTARQGIVFDTRGAGGVSITADGKWTQSFAGVVTDGSIGATAAVVGNQWYHVMHHIYHTSQPGFPVPLSNERAFTGVVYVNGLAVSASNGSVFPGQLDNGDYAGVLAVGAEEISNDGFNPLFDNHFQGVVDDLQMYVYGDSSDSIFTPAGQDFGTFNLFTDNAWIAAQTTAIPGGVLKPGDVTRDGSVNQGDVTAFVTGWKKEKKLRGALSEMYVGDWETWGWGDLNVDGLVNLQDAILLNDGLIAAGQGELNFDLLNTSVPEPTSVGLGLLGWATFCLSRGRRRHRG